MKLISPLNHTKIVGDDAIYSRSESSRRITNAAQEERTRKNLEQQSASLAALNKLQNKNKIPTLGNHKSWKSSSICGDRRGVRLCDSIDPWRDKEEVC